MEPRDPVAAIGRALGEDLFSVTLAPGTVREGETLVIDASIEPLPPTEGDDGISTVEGSQMWVVAEVVAGDTGSCEPVEG